MLTLNLTNGVDTVRVSFVKGDRDHRNIVKSDRPVTLALRYAKDRLRSDLGWVEDDGVTPVDIGNWYPAPDEHGVVLTGLK